MSGPKTVDEYMSFFPGEIQEIIMKLREAIKKAAPEAREVISYQMPGYKLNGMLVWFALHKNHIGFYPGASGIREFKKEIFGYKWAKGSVQFSLDKPVPYKLIERIVKFRVKENILKSELKKKKKF